MTIQNFISLLGGLGLFLYGMSMMGNGLEAAAGDRLKTILEKLTSNRILGVLVGAIVTAVIQSSSATTVMVVGFVNAQMMSLQQAVWIIMGANIGTTITGQLIALDISAIAPLIAFIGVALVTFCKKQKVIDIGQIIAGLGILFIGMNLMSTAMSPLRNSPEFVQLVTNFSNPVIGILVGAGFTALIQSSSASVGILQALAASGVIGLDGAVYVLFGQNIGTCITAVLASIGTSREAKQTTVIHLSFNIIGTIIFTIVCMSTPLVPMVIHWTPYSATQQIANMHTLFNVCTTLILLPFGTYLARFAQHIMPIEKKDADDRLLFLQPLPKSNKMIGGSAISVKQVHDETFHMIALAYKNVYEAFDQLLKFNEEKDQQIYEREDTVNFLNREISDYIGAALAMPNLNTNVSQALSSYYLMLVDVERISDYAVNMNKQATKGLQSKMTITEIEVIERMKSLCLQMEDNLQDVEEAERKDDEIDALVSTWREEQIQALKQQKCSREVSMMLSRIFTDFERINDHALNVSQELEKIDVELHE